ncbi:mucolipin-3 isoform X1 [Sebastes umbrosus]|uniref:mucolipin-3 isoform X1 n=1 Tax=Sebastes umbrosus TaxID=72105 RepID=UPI00189C84A2|nr:mucolipin-3 isoform X1 [Sebastes umbrosus]XP_037626297.1 mucolipin-3 isoform X1 [Sebastes umbrosus]XP_037626298.1 mucolipin-3 isoform X1 [Sebastes umbrosus]XP_037626299.1 mucolipin-3 isoform X1 [Sebastes umbrosus]XP_037626300.1 mucolipin-3 isoform X1 [Sebastes umbrosus]
MDESSDLYDGYEENGSPPWADNQHQVLEELDNVESLRRKIKYYFMNPCEKYHARGRKPWKLILQIVKIAIITIQLVSFGLSNQMVVKFKEENLMAFKHIFLKDYVDGGMNTYAVYRQTHVYDHIDYIIEQYGHLHNITVGNHEYEKNGPFYNPMLVCQEFYRNGTIYPANETFEIDAQVDIECHEVYPMYRPSLREALPDFELHFKRMIFVKITFVLKAINLQTVRHRELPDCYDFTVIITFDNEAHSGRIKVDLETDVDINECRDWKVTGATPRNIYLTVLFDCLIIITCIISFTLCTRSVINGIQLQSEYTLYCKNNCGKEVSWSDKLEFLNGWYILIILSDTLTIIGSILKIEIQTKVLTSYDVCSIFLGTGTMFVWIGVIRYMGYFRKYNILILTLRAAFPNVIRFIWCAGIIYLSYCLCGWIVLGPYHEKFRTLNTVSECLFSLINGDDMFTTFKDMKQKSSLVWIFSRVYLYTFVSLFIYMILSLFITIITDTYDTIKQQQQSGTPTSELQKFMSVCQDLPNSGMYRLDENKSCFLNCCITRCRKLREGQTSEA